MTELADGFALQAASAMLALKLTGSHFPFAKLTVQKIISLHVVVR